METFYLAAEFREKYPAEAGSWGAAGQELNALVQAHPAEASESRISRDFGVPHPTLEQTNACAILQVKLKYIGQWNDARRGVANRYDATFRTAGLAENV